VRKREKEKERKREKKGRGRFHYFHRGKLHELILSSLKALGFRFTNQLMVLNFKMNYKQVHIRAVRKT